MLSKMIGSISSYNELCDINSWLAKACVQVEKKEPLNVNNIT